MEIQKHVLKMPNYRTCLHAGVWTLYVAKEQTLTTAHGLTDRGTCTQSHSYGCSWVCFCCSDNGKLIKVTKFMWNSIFLVNITV